MALLHRNVGVSDALVLHTPGYVIELLLSGENPKNKVSNVLAELQTEFRRDDSGGGSLQS